MVRRGVFTITNKITGRVYIGSSNTNLDDRLYYYLQELKSGKHHNDRLQADFNKYGESNFKYEVVIGNCKSEAEVRKNRKRLLQSYMHNTYNKDVDVYFGGGNSDPWSKGDYKKLNKVMRDLIGIIVKSNLSSYNKRYLENQVKKSSITTQPQLNKKIKEKTIEEADEYWKESVKLGRKKEYEEAIKFINKAIKLRPKHKGYRNKLKELTNKQKIQESNATKSNKNKKPIISLDGEDRPIGSGLIEIDIKEVDDQRMEEEPDYYDFGDGYYYGDVNYDEDND